MCSLNVSLIKYKCVECCSVRMRLCIIRICVLFLFWTAFSGDAPKLTIFVWYTCHLGTSAQARHWCIPSAQSSRMRCTKGRVPVGTHTPVETARWQEPQHMGYSQCKSYVGLSFIRTHYSYLCNIHSVLWVLVIVYCVHILWMLSSFVLLHFEWSNKV